MISYANSSTNMSEDFIELPKNKNGDYVLPIIIGYESYSPYSSITVTSAYIFPNFDNNKFTIHFTVTNNSGDVISFSYDRKLSFTLYTVIPKLSS